MKGPYERLKYELRRVFECPRCHRRLRVFGNVTSAFCTCTHAETGKSVCMALTEDGTRRIDGRVLTKVR